MNMSMAEDTVHEQVFAFIASQVGVDPAVLRPESTLSELGVSSLEAIELIFDIEEHFGITFPDEAGGNFGSDTLQHLIDAVRNGQAAKLVEQGAA